MDVKAKVEQLLVKMNLREKAGQMTQITIDTICAGKAYAPDDPLTILPDKLERAAVEYGVGSMLNVGTYAHSLEKWHNLIDTIQAAAQRSRLQIPILYGIDSIHGANYVAGSTLFPQQLALASTWNPDIVEELAAISAYETRAAGIPWTFSPVADLGRHAVWPRLWETFGEDVHLCTALTLAATVGTEGEAINHPHRVAGCLKHFLGYGQPLSGKDRTPAWIPERYLREYYLPPFAAAIKAGARTIMINSGEINGIPVHADRRILHDLLREELGFTGVAVTDWEDIKYLHIRHKVADSYKEAVRIAILAGVDMSMTPLDTEFTDYLVELVEEGAITEARLDESVRRILTLKFELGLFEQTRFATTAYPEFAGKHATNTALQAARESVLLLKNEEDVLPLRAGQKILVTGPTANTLRSLYGGWSLTWQGERTDELLTDQTNLLQAMEQTLGSESVTYVPGASFDEIIDLTAVKEAANDTDVILLCLGESSYTEFYGSIDDLALPIAQQQLADVAVATGKPVVLVLLQGRPRTIDTFVGQTSAVVASFYPGQGGGQALVDVLIGRYNPSGRLPITYPRHSNALELYDHKATENLPLQGVRAMYNPLFKFGEGLSYTTFIYSALELTPTEVMTDTSIQVQVTVRNDGELAGSEVVQVFISDEFASITPPVERLRAFKKVALAPGEQAIVQFDIPVKDLAFVGQDLRWIAEEGDFNIRVGTLSKKITLKKSFIYVTF